MGRNLDKQEGVLKANQVIESLAKKLQEIYGSKWNFEIDVVPEGDLTKNYSLKVKIYKR